MFSKEVLSHVPQKVLVAKEDEHNHQRVGENFPYLSVCGLKSVLLDVHRLTPDAMGREKGVLSFDRSTEEMKYSCLCRSLCNLLSHVMKSRKGLAFCLLFVWIYQNFT